MKTPTPEIRQAFYRHLLDNLWLTELGEDDIAWPNAHFTPKTDRVYIAPFCLFSETDIATLSAKGFEELKGIFQIGIYGVPGHGEGAIDELAATFTDIFRGGTILNIPCYGAVTIKKAWRSSLMMDGGERGSSRPHVAVSVSWHQFTQKGEA